MPRKGTTRVTKSSPSDTPDTERLETLVGQEVYAVWVKMLKALVPDGRTHRLATVIAGMLIYAVWLAPEEPEEGSAAALLVDANENGYSDEAIEALATLAAQLFDDATVKYRRTSRAGEHYSIAQEAAMEFMNWYNMPWD